MPDSRTAPVPTLRRLPAYLRFLQKIQANGRSVVSCTHIAEDLRLDPTQVRKDLATTGIVGKPRVGYEIPALIQAIEAFLGWDNRNDAFLIGAGNLGSAIIGHEAFRKIGLNIVAAFDNDPKKVGSMIHGIEVMPMEKLEDLASRMHILIGILTVPVDIAQDTATRMTASGFRAIWNFAPTQLDVPETVIVEDVHLSSSLAVLSNRLSAMLDAEREEKNVESI